MKSWLAICAALAIGGCISTSDWSIVQGGPGSPDTIYADVHDCYSKAADAFSATAKLYQQQHPYYGLSLLAGGLAGAGAGAIAGAAVGATAGSLATSDQTSTPDASPSPILFDSKVFVRECMAAKGYVPRP